jgi:predicted nucleic acid-binding protein
VLIDALNGKQGAIAFLSTSGPHHISVLTRSEVVAGCKSEAATGIALQLCDDLQNHDMDKNVADHAGRLRMLYGLKTPDAVIVATAISCNQILVTRDQRLAKIPNLRVESYSV